jgi:hypothetical protein
MRKMYVVLEDANLDFTTDCGIPIKSQRCVAGLDYSALAFPEKRRSDLRSACGDDSGRRATHLSSTPWHVIYITCAVLVLPYVFFDLLDLNGSDFPNSI